MKFLVPPAVMGYTRRLCCCAAACVRCRVGARTTFAQACSISSSASPSAESARDAGLAHLEKGTAGETPASARVPLAKNVMSVLPPSSNATEGGDHAMSSSSLPQTAADIGLGSLFAPELSPESDRMNVTGFTTMPSLTPPPLRPDGIVYLSSERGDAREETVAAAMQDGDFWADEKYSISAALFGLSDMQTNGAAYCPPRSRVTTGMGLLPEWARETLFLQTGWVQQLEDGVLPSPTQTSTPSSPPSSPPHRMLAPRLNFKTYMDIFGRAKVMRYLFWRLLTQQELWTDAAEELISLATRQAVRHYLGPDATEELVQQLTQASSLSVSDRLRTPTEDVVFFSPGLFEKLAGLLMPVLADRTGDKGALAGEEGRCLQELFESPSGVWEAFAVSHRHDAAHLPSPHRPPFTFAEVAPTIAPQDLDSPCVATAAALEDTAAASIAAAQDRQKLPAAFAENWDSLSEERQNELLFGAKPGRAKESIDRGIYVFDVAEDVVSKGTDLATAASERNTASPASGEGGTSTRTEPVASDGTTSTPGTRVRTDEERLANEKARWRSYALDAFYIGIAEPPTPQQRSILQYRAANAWRTPTEEPGDTPPSADPSCESTSVPSSLPASDGASATSAGAESTESPAPLKRARRKVHAQTASDQYLPGGQFRHGVTGVVEDVHLASLWALFQAEETSTLLDNTLHVSQRWQTHLRTSVREELASQLAFLLLFHARNEVRAVTPPRDTYARLWSLHHALHRVLLPWVAEVAAETGVLNGGTTDLSRTLVLGLPSSVPDFSTRSPSCQASFTCFGGVHVSPTVPLRSSASLAETVLATRGGVPCHAAPAAQQHWQPARDADSEGVAAATGDEPRLSPQEDCGANAESILSSTATERAEVESGTLSTAEEYSADALKASRYLEISTAHTARGEATKTVSAVFPKDKSGAAAVESQNPTTPYETVLHGSNVSPGRRHTQAVLTSAQRAFDVPGSLPDDMEARVARKVQARLLAALPALVERLVAEALEQHRRTSDSDRSGQTAMPLGEGALSTTDHAVAVAPTLTESEPHPRRRGRKQKHTSESLVQQRGFAGEPAATLAPEEPGPQVKVPKKRGRKPKVKLAAADGMTTSRNAREGLGTSEGDGGEITGITSGELQPASQPIKETAPSKRSLSMKRAWQRRKAAKSGKSVASDVKRKSETTVDGTTGDTAAQLQQIQEFLAKLVQG